MKIDTSDKIRWFINNLSNKYMELPTNVSIKIDLDKEDYDKVFEDITGRVEYNKELINESYIIGEYCGVKVHITNKK